MNFPVSDLTSYQELIEQQGLKSQTNLSISHAFKEITIDNTSEQDKILIDIGKDHNVVCIRSKVYLNNGNQLQFTESRHKLEKFKFVYYAKRHH